MHTVTAFLLLSSTLALAIGAKPPVEVRTSRGAVRGFHEDLGDDKSSLFHGSADVFLGVPFAQPPIGELRFKLPRPICSYGDGVNATYYRDQCPQQSSFRFEREPELHASDDCLHLNIASPSIKGKYPVMVWIHGGGLTFGSADIYDYRGSIVNMVNHGVVVVTIQYRLSVTGFFTTYTEDFPANRGYFDQILALRWIQEEISHFGGDPNQVTIFGESAGAIAVAMLSLTPVARGLFHKVIQQSGAAFMNLPNNPLDMNKRKAELICGVTKEQWNTGDFSRLKECLNKKSSNELAHYDWPHLQDIQYDVWKAHLDGALFPQPPSVLARDRPNYPVILGVVSNEFAIFMDQDINAYNSTFLDTHMNRMFGAKGPLLTDLIKRTFIREPLQDDDHVGWFKVAEEAMSNLFFVASTRRDTQWYLNNENPNVYLYNYNWKKPTPCRTVEVGGVPTAFHSADFCYLWRFPYHFSHDIFPITAGDVELSEFMGKAWTNFAKSTDHHPNEHWTPVTSDFEYYKFDEIPGHMEKNFASEGNVLFNKVFPALLGEWLPETADPDTLRQLQEVGPKVLAEFNRNWCGRAETTIRNEEL